MLLAFSNKYANLWMVFIGSFYGRSDPRAGVTNPSHIDMLMLFPHWASELQTSLT